MSPSSSNCFSVWYANWSALFLVSIDSFLFLSSSANFSASFTALSTSSSERLVEAVIVIFASLPVPLSIADTLTIPVASISNVTSIWGIPLGAGAIPDKVNLPKVLLSLAICLSPWTTWISTDVWPSAAVENTWLFLAGIVVFLSINGVATPPKVSIPNVNGVTSNNNTSLTSPVNTPAWIAAPIATHSSGLTPFEGSFPVKFLTASWTAGILVDPPTNITLSIWPIDNPASLNAFFIGSIDLWTKSWVNSLNFALVKFISMCFGPVASAVMNGKFIFVCIDEDNSILAFSAASFNLWTALLSFLKSIPYCDLKSFAI